ncbi:glycine betaine ABC transporter substrate-binding protein [Egicoccus halophilus]|uniref:ABC transporter n=1 Tax=Egicoccus halophilus TaxID=1670830 RepID=A0A8J3A660_9ACTN|nr:glycine betaine ABC transporter substrate-binding protein [Egicoccus halophilus]GGI04287.1 ABC transporter [Egicoccus halophilus]
MWQPGRVRRWLCLLLILFACTSQVDTGVPAGSDDVATGDLSPLRIASGPELETRVLAHTVQRLLELAGQPTRIVVFGDGRDARQAMELGDVDVQAGYTGETWLETLGRADPPGDPRASFVAVRDHDEPEDLVWLRPRFGDGSLDQPPANATFAFVVQGAAGPGADLRTLSDLARRLSEQPDALVCVDREFGTRVDGLRAVLEAYSVRSDRAFLAADPEEAVRGVAAGDCLAGLTTTTDGAAWGAGLRPLVDDLRVFPAFVPLPQIRAEVIEERPTVRVALGPMAAQLTTALLGSANARVTAGEPVEQVADELARELLVLARRTLPEDVEG